MIQIVLILILRFSKTVSIFISLLQTSSAESSHDSCDMISFDHAYLQLIETLKTFKTSDNQLVRENCATT